MPELDIETPSPLLRGGARMKQLAAENATVMREIEAELIASLGRLPTAIDRIAIETLVASVVRARRLREQGKSDADERKTILQAIRATGIRPSPVGVSPTGPNIQDLLDQVAAQRAEGPEEDDA